MTPRQFQFVREYLVDMNATRAMIRAGYSSRTANKHVSRLLDHHEVRRLIDAALTDRDSKVRIEATVMLEEMASEAKSELLTARENLQAATRHLMSASNTVRDIERLCVHPTRSVAEAPTPNPLPVAAPHLEYSPILPWPDAPGLAMTDYSPLD